MGPYGPSDWLLGAFISYIASHLMYGILAWRPCKPAINCRVNPPADLTKFNYNFNWPGHHCRDEQGFPITTSPYPTFPDLHALNSSNLGFNLLPIASILRPFTGGFKCYTPFYCSGKWACSVRVISLLFNEPVFVHVTVQKRFHIIATIIRKRYEYIVIFWWIGLIIM